MATRAATFNRKFSDYNLMCSSTLHGLHVYERYEKVKNKQDVPSTR